MRISMPALILVIAVGVCALADVVHMKDGRKLEGKIVSEKEETIELKMKYGTITLRRSDIERIEKTEPAEKLQPKPEPESEPEPAGKQQPQEPEKKPHPAWKVRLDEKKIQKLIRYLRSIKHYIYASRRLAEAGEQAVAPLISLFREEEIPTYTEETLVKIGKAAVGPLLKALKDRDEIVRTHAARVLGEIGDREAVEPLIEALKEKSDHVRDLAADALGKIGDKKAVEPLIGLLKDKRWEIRVDAAESLAYIGDIRAAGALKKLWKEDKNPVVQLSAAFGVVKTTASKETYDFIVSVLKDKSSENRRYAALRLGDIGGEKSIHLLIDLLGNEDFSLRGGAYIALKKTGKKAVMPLTKMLSAEKSDTRHLAALALMDIGDKRAIEPLIEALKTGLTSTAATALGGLGDKKAVEPLINALRHENKHYRSRAAGALEKLQEPKAVKALLSTLRDKEESVCEAAAFALAATGAPAVKPLIGALKGASRSVQAHIGLALERMQDENAVEPLIKALKNTKGSIHTTIRETLERLTLEDIDGGYKEWYEWWEKNKVK